MLRGVSDSAFLNPPGQCDLIMQGGITSGVVYPPAVLKLARRYRFRSIGGTSAGAIAAAAAAAAELGRDSGGFERLAQVPDDIAGRLSSLFQPAPPFRGAYAVFVACLGKSSLLKKTLRVPGLLLRHFWISLLIGLSPLILYILRSDGSHRDALEWIAIVACGLILSVLTLLIQGLWLALYELPRYDFGVCPGLRPGYSGKPALTEWIAELLVRLAGVGDANHPLTFGQLRSRNIELKMMTTNLSSCRPYSLPFATRGNPRDEARYSFKVEEWRRYFPQGVMSWLETNTVEVPGQPGLRFLPESDDLPVIVAVRMSLSFPVLLAAIPLYRRDFTCLAQEERDKMRRCMFSDGGISSNFPIHFFDTLLPTRPTFAISLENYTPLRFPDDRPENRVYLPQDAASGFLLPINRVDSTLAFAGAIINSARTWQDNLQRILSGYRERIAHVALNDFEGGLNLDMPEEVIRSLSGLGALAGEHLLQFNLQEHQWRRLLVAYARLEEMFANMHQAYAEGFEQFVDTYPPDTQSYKPSLTWLQEVRSRLATLLEATQDWDNPSLRTTGRIPKPDTDLRITPKP